ncbi:MAG: Na+/H+ antiporter NhaA [Mesorhizobium sp.]|uniref:Na+/H+ antiporter NhaA n=1 Tax=Mesorhizobium sp. TaxID=1871066 RepID=UPI0011F99A78|nr:Na+/H+ antiporter NhaA [Mesorhizobium sp.]TIQ08748.1 MAG: Na+/H+ antiporter NhaA [Mesorhizobium sp.]
MNINWHTKDPTLQSLFEKRVEKIFSPLEIFIYRQTTAAILLALAALLALILANSPWNRLAENIAAIEMGLVLHHWHVALSIREWISSGFMAMFFFLIGLEIKRETLAGKLRQPQQVSLIVLAAAGGMIFPALIYWGINHSGPGEHGWAIPMATDTAFAIGVLALLAKRVSYGISIFLTAMAIFDDIGAILVISIFYTDELEAGPLLGAGVVLVLLFLINIMGVRRSWVYALLGFVLWFFVHDSGIHATLAGLLLAVTIPARTRLGEMGFIEEVRSLLLIFEKGRREHGGILGSAKQHALAADIGAAVKAASTPLQRWETLLIYPIGIIVLPLFALFNAGISLSGEALAAAMSSPVTLGVMAGLVIGKPLGISLMVLFALRLKVGKLPEGMTISEVVGVGMLGGIGFTMSLFITALSFDQPNLIDEAKTGIVFSSLISAIAASAWIYFTHRARQNITATE